MELKSSSPAVLVVDDDDIVLATVRRALENTGYRVLAASSAQEAVDIVRAGSTSVTVAILDYGMPDLPGTELGTMLGELCPGLRIIISSGTPFGSIPLKPGQTFLDKPFNSRTLLSAVLGEILGASALQNSGK